ncbi:MAG: hypothetical protein P4L99_12660 [Chthoniobacter sp.]|nr:hypothetical protein [Chthoniobacter sp.]
MSSHHHHHQRHASDGGGVHHEHVPYWKRAHSDWRFWVGAVLMFAAMIIYVMSMDLAWRPRLAPEQPISGNVGK